MAMKDSEAKKRWDKENVVVITTKLFRKTDMDVIEYLEGKSRRDTILAALRYYIENHKEE